MKTRSGFVSNSSSSSFIVVGTAPEGCNYTQLSKVQATAVIEFARTSEYYSPQDIKWDGEEPVYLTQYLSDCVGLDEQFKNYNDLSVYTYVDGGHGGRYSEDYHTVIGKSTWEANVLNVTMSDAVWIRKEHDEN